MKQCFLKTIIVVVISCILMSCNKTKTTTSTCDSCDAVKNTVYFALDWVGQIGYNNEFKKWTVNVRIPYSLDGTSTCILCTDIPDSLKVVGKIATFSGELKETCAIVTPQIGGQEVYSIKPSKIQ
jgi:hypothetical protein